MASSAVIAEPTRHLELEPESGLDSDAGRIVSEELYWRDYYFVDEPKYEWNNGRLEVKPVSDYGTFLVYDWFLSLLRYFLLTHPMAKMIGLDMGFRLALPSRTVIRKPDLGVVRHDNRQPLLTADARYHGIFDLCIEALSDRERGGVHRDMVVKRADYAAAGVKEYYILHHAEPYQAFYQLAPGAQYQPIPPIDGVISSRVLPGFQFRIDDLTRRPSTLEMYRDPLYQRFVLPQWSASEQQAKETMEQARFAEQRAQQAEQQIQEEQARAIAAEQERDALAAELAQLRARVAKPRD